jgi:CheY-like chemotaxis protein
MTEKHILHIEDNFHNRRIVRKILEKQGYLLHEAADGVIGFNMIQEMKPPMVLLDISLPGMDGIEIAQKVKGDDDLKHIILIAVTASAMQGDRERFLAAGCDDYLSKPFRSIDLLDLVNQYYAEIPESYMASFQSKDVIHPIEEHFVMGGPESQTPTKQTQEEVPEPIAPITEETLADAERGFFTRKEEAPQAEEPTDEPVESLQKSDLLKTASLEGIFSNEELEDYMEDNSPAEEAEEAAEEAPESMPAMAFAGEAEGEEEEEDDDEIITWVMPRNGAETPPIEEEYPIEEVTADTVESLKETGVTKTALPQEIASEEGLDESPIEERPEPAAAEESEEATQVWHAPAKPDEIELDTDFLRPSVLDEARDEELMAETPEPAAAEESEAPVAETLPAGAEMQAESSEEDESDEIIQTWRAPDKTDELVLDTDLLEPSALEEAAKEDRKEDKEETAPRIVSPTEVVEKLMSLTSEEQAAVTESDLEEEPTKPVASLEEMATTSPEVEDGLTAEPASEGEEEAFPEPAAFLEELATADLETEEEETTEPAASPEDEIETIRIDADKAWDFEKELESEDVLSAEPAPETEEKTTPEPVVSPDRMTTTTLEAEDALVAESEPETEEEAVTEPATSPEDEIETIRIDASEAGGLEKELEAEETEAPQEIAKRSTLDDTGPLKEEILEASIAEERHSESPSNGSGEEGRSQKKESSKKNDLTDQVVRMINPEMIRPVDPNVGVEGG